jgi:hypothetical protein
VFDALIAAAIASSSSTLTGSQPGIGSVSNRRRMISTRP